MNVENVCESYASHVVLIVGLIEVLMVRAVAFLLPLMVTLIGAGHLYSQKNYQSTGHTHSVVDIVQLEFLAANALHAIDVNFY